MLREIEVAAVVDAFDFLRTEGSAEIELDIERRARVVREFGGGVLMEFETSGIEAERMMPFHPLVLPVLERLHVLARLDKKLHFHLFEFTRTENKVARRDLVGERFAYLRDPKG